MHSNNSKFALRLNPNWRYLNAETDGDKETVIQDALNKSPLGKTVADQKRLKKEKERINEARQDAEKVANKNLTFSPEERENFINEYVAEATTLSIDGAKRRAATLDGGVERKWQGASNKRIEAEKKQQEDSKKIEFLTQKFNLSAGDAKDAVEEGTTYNALKSIDDQAQLMIKQNSYPLETVTAQPGLPTAAEINQLTNDYRQQAEELALQGKYDELKKLNHTYNIASVSVNQGVPVVFALQAAKESISPEGDIDYIKIDKYREVGQEMRNQAQRGNIDLSSPQAQNDIKTVVEARQIFSPIPQGDE